MIYATEIPIQKNQSLIIICMNGAFIFLKNFYLFFFVIDMNLNNKQKNYYYYIKVHIKVSFIYSISSFFLLTKTDKTKRNKTKKSQSNGNHQTLCVCIYHILSQIYNTHTECLSSLNSCFSFVRLLVRFGSFMSITIIHPSSSTFHIDIFKIKQCCTYTRKKNTAVIHTHTSNKKKKKKNLTIRQ